MPYDERIVLLVEDDGDTLELALQAFKRSGSAHRIVVARDGQEALDLLFGNEQPSARGANVPPNLVLLDLHLPKISGLDVLEKIRANVATRLVPVVVLSSSSEHRDLVEAYERGANSYVRKPVDFGGFVETLDRLSHYWLVLNEGVPST